MLVTFLIVGIGNARGHRRGFALPYALVVCAILIVAMTAIFYRVSHTLRMTLYNESMIRARRVADTGAQLAFVLMRDYDAKWFVGKLPVASSSLGPDYSEDAIGGSFTIDIQNANTFPTSPFPDRGTFKVIRCVGRAGNAEAVTVISVKVTNPLLNYVVLSPHNLTFWMGDTLVGPISVNADPDSGQAGDLRFVHDKEWWQAIPGRWIHNWGTINLAAEVRATGQLYIRNDAPNGYNAGPMLLEGKYPPQSITHKDMVILDPGSPGTAQGKLTLTQELSSSPKTPFNTRVPLMAEMLENYRDNAYGNVVEVDISNYGSGVLAEFADGELSLSPAATKQVGWLFDRDVWENQRSSIIGEYRRLYNESAANAEAYAKTEVAWDDPDFDERPYPPDLVPEDWDGVGGVETEGDCSPIHRVIRGGNPFYSVGLNDSDWTVVRLVTGRTNHPTLASWQNAGPPVYVRGIVDGKVVLVYDVASDALDPDMKRLSMMILGQHEDPADSTFKVAAAGPGVPGGLIYADRRTKSSRDMPGPVTEDAAVLLCRGWVRHAGPTPGRRRIVRDMAGNRRDENAQLQQLSEDYSAFYTGAANDPDFDLTDGWDLRGNIHGIAISAHSDDTPNYSGDGLGFTVGAADRKHSSVPWDDFSGPYPPFAAPYVGVSPSRDPQVLNEFRSAIMPGGHPAISRGGFHALGSSLDVDGGDLRFDYRFQELTEDEIEEMGLRLGVVPISLQRF
ncbi:MAG: hypothetical protein HY319_14800 [Armatimonadetes bacterium]|nr:hypothetical protein [Armatimonadota bacterium]